MQNPRTSDEIKYNVRCRLVFCFFFLCEFESHILFKSKEQHKKNGILCFCATKPSSIRSFRSSYIFIIMSMHHRDCCVVSCHTLCAVQQCILLSVHIKLIQFQQKNIDQIFTKKYSTEYAQKLT